MRYHRQQMETKIKSLESICQIQSERLARMQAQFDTSLAQMVTVLRANQNGGVPVMDSDDEYDNGGGDLQLK